MRIVEDVTVVVEVGKVKVNDRIVKNHRGSSQKKPNYQVALPRIGKEIAVSPR